MCILGYQNLLYGPYVGELSNDKRPDAYVVILNVQIGQFFNCEFWSPKNSTQYYFDGSVNNAGSV
jgi:hypothetical protein